MKTYETLDEFFKEGNLNRLEEHEKCFSRIVEALDFNTCKQILLSYLKADGISPEKLKEKYKQDKYLNNIYKHSGRGVWEWDLIGADMLHNPNAQVRFKLMSDSHRTCIAKACARMIAENKEVMNYV